MEVDQPDASTAAVYFLSDYGLVDEFVGVVHAVLLQRAPTATVVDLSHQIPPFDLVAGASMLVRCAPFLGPGVVLAVVDPGVGTARRGVAIQTAGQGHQPNPTWLIGPDNGLLMPMAAALGGVRRAVHLGPARSDRTSSGRSEFGATFDGRDLFAPAAAHLVLGGPYEELGDEVDRHSLVELVPPGLSRVDRDRSRSTASWASVAVTWIDRFGNIQVDLGPRDLEHLGVTAGGIGWIEVEGGSSGGRRARVRRVEAFGDLDDGEIGLVIDANGQVAVVLNQGSAALLLGIGAHGAVVRISSHGRNDPAI